MTQAELNRQIAGAVAESIRHCTPGFAWDPKPIRQSRMLLVLAVLVVLAFIAISAILGGRS